MVYDVVPIFSARWTRSFHDHINVTTATLPSGPAYQLGWPGETLTFAPYKTHQPMKSLMELASLGTATPR
jgi:hypothetical protein